MSLRASVLAIALLATQATAQNDPGAAAQAAAKQLEDATVSLQQADGARDRVRALTATVRAFESGLGAMRAGLRRAATREAQLSRQLQVRRGEIAELLGVLQVISTTPPPVLMAHPSGPLGSARSGMILAELTPALNERAARLRKDLEEVQTLKLLQENAVATLESGLAGVQKARAELSQAIADRTDLPRRFTEDPVKTAILLASTETLDGFASGLAQITEGADPAPVDNVGDLKGTLDLPVRGVVLHRAGEAGAAGVVREGLVIATRPRSLVISPTAATIRYRGPLLDLGNVVILEPRAGTLFVLSGLAEVYGEAGEVIPAGAPVGLMGGADPEIGAILSTSGDGAGADRSETLYMEVREGGKPVDPETWFKIN